VVVRSVPGLTLRYGTRVAREQGIGLPFYLNTASTDMDSPSAVLDALARTGGAA
jgi:hypothetical protein